jgi:hypothetical protein
MAKSLEAVMAINQSDKKHLVCPECLCFDEDFDTFPETKKEGNYCPLCYILGKESGPKLKMVTRKEFYKMIAVKIVKEILD